MAYIWFMKKENLIFIIIICLLVGFVAGVAAGIKFATKDSAPAVKEAVPSQGELTIPSKPNVPSPEEMKALEDLVKKEPGNLQALINLGNRYFDAQSFEKAIDVYSKALKIDPKNADVRTDMAIMYRGLKDYNRAVKELKEAAAMNPGHVNSRYNLGVVLLHDKKDVDGAIAAWEDCLKAGATGEQADRIRQQLTALKTMAR